MGKMKNLPWNLSSVGWMLRRSQVLMAMNPKDFFFFFFFLKMKNEKTKIGIRVRGKRNPIYIYIYRYKYRNVYVCEWSDKIFWEIEITENSFRGFKI